MTIKLNARIAALFAAPLLAVMVAAATLAPQPAAAQGQGGVPVARVLFLDLEGVFQKSAVGRNIRGQLEQMLGDVQKRSNTVEQGYEKRQADLFASRAGKAEDQLRKEWNDLQTQRAGEMQMFQIETQAIQLGAADARRKVNGVLNEIMRQILSERGANMILDVKAVHVGGVDYDITAEVIARLDKRMPSLKVEKGAVPKK